MKAPIPTKENVLQLLKKSLTEQTMFKYRMAEDNKKNMAVDTSSVNMIVKVAEALRPDNRDKFLSIAPNVGRMAIIAWSCAK